MASAATALVQIPVSSGVPVLQRRSGTNSKSAAAVKCASSASGLRLNNDRLALRTAFYNGGSAITADAVPATGTDSHGGGRIVMRVASKGAYICKDCGYIYSSGTPFEKLSSDYSCPVCAAPKRRFKPYEQPVARNANDQGVRKARKAELKQGAGVGSLPIGIAIGAAALLGTYIYVNSSF